MDIMNTGFVSYLVRYRLQLFVVEHWRAGNGMSVADWSRPADWSRSKALFVQEAFQVLAFQHSVEQRSFRRVPHPIH